MTAIRPPRTLDRPAPVFTRPVQLGPEVASYVRELILSGQLTAGTRLNVDTLARDLGVSATPVREGLLALRGDGFVSFERQRGFRVAPLSRHDVEDLYWIQSTIAGELAARAAGNDPARLAERLTGFQERLRDALDRHADDEVEAANFEFHRAINQAAESRKLAWLLGVAVRYAPRRFFSMIRGWAEASLKDHDSIIAAIRAGDPTASREAMTAHILHGGTLLAENLERQGFWAEDGHVPDEAGDEGPDA